MKKQETKNSEFTGSNDEQKVSKETQQSGEVDSTVYKAYLKAVKKPIMVVAVIFLFIAAQVFHSGTEYFISIW